LLSSSEREFVRAKRRFDVLGTLEGRRTSWEEVDRTRKGERSRCLGGTLKESLSLREEALFEVI
jgi:hypothetical protein